MVVSRAFDSIDEGAVVPSACLSGDAVGRVVVRGATVTGVGIESTGAVAGAVGRTTGADLAGAGCSSRGTINGSSLGGLAGVVGTGSSLKSRNTGGVPGKAS